jgi:Flp pilus assembly protein TadD
LANVALAIGDHATAEKAYREALAREPGSGRAYFGLAASLEGLGNSTEARTVRAKAAKAWAAADADLPQMKALKATTATAGQ